MKSLYDKGSKEIKASSDIFGKSKKGTEYWLAETLTIVYEECDEVKVKVVPRGSSIILP